MNKNEGYTLIELLVVIGIFSLLFGFSFAAYTNFNKSRSLENGAGEVETVLRDAQHRAVTGEYDQTKNFNGVNTNDDCAKLLNWVVSWTVNSANYTLVGNCQTQAGGTRIFKSITNSLSAVGTVQFSNSGNVAFNPFLNSPTISNPVCIHFSGENNSFYKITITIGGTIDVEKTNTCS